jgi:hypothetical protein
MVRNAICILCLLCAGGAWAGAGTLDAGLTERLDGLAPETRERVVAWLTHPPALLAAFHPAGPGVFKPEGEPRPTPARERLNAIRARERALVRRRAALRARLHAHIDARLAAAGIAPERVVYRFASAPAAVLDLTAAECRALAARPGVARLYRDFDRAEKELDVSMPAANAFAAWNAGYRGEGVTLAHIETEPGRFASPFVGAEVYRPEGAADLHATFIGGIIRSAATPRRGIAHRCTLLNVNPPDGSKSSWAQGIDWALRRGAVLFNTSDNLFTDGDTLHWSDIYFDYLAHYTGIFFSKSAGNWNGSSGSRIVTSPGRGYNSVTVGNVNGRATAAWADDVMAETSRDGNPATGTEKPEMCAYGMSMTSTVTNAPWFGTWPNSGGTSFAAPFVAGIAVLCVDAVPELAGEPQALKAMLMAGGLARNIEGAAAPEDASRDGAGMVPATAYRCGVQAVTLQPGDFGTNGTWELPAGISLTAGDTKRVVLAYTHAPHAPDAPDAESYDRSDLDLRLQVDGGTVAESTNAPANPFEIIDYTAPLNGTGRVWIVKTDWDSDTPALRIGVAWVSRSTLGDGPDRTATVLELR